MAVKLRLRRMGKKRQPIYKVVAADARAPRDGKFLESIGLYNPLTNPSTVNIKEDRALYWLGVGAQPTDTVKSLLSQKGILLKKELQSKGLSEDQINSELENWKKQKEGRLEAKANKESASKKKTAEAKAPVSEEVSTEKANEESEQGEGTAEVKGAASEENPDKQ